MFRRENPVSGEGNTVEQEVYRNEYQRAGAAEITLGKRKRELLHTVVVPRWNYINAPGGRRIYSHKPLRPVMHHSECQFLSMWDRPYAKSAERGRRIQTIAILQEGRLDRGTPTISSAPDSKMWVDFAKPMFRTHQVGIDCQGGLGALKADMTGRPGFVRLVRTTSCTGDFLDVCMNELPNGDFATIYRLRVEDFQGSDPRAVLEVGSIPEKNGEVMTVGMVEPSTTLVKLRKPCGYRQAAYKDGRFQLMFGRPTSSWNLDDEHQVFLFRCCNEMQKIMNDVVLDDVSELVQDPSTWAPDVLVEFDQSTFDSLTLYKEFEVTDALMLDMLKALRSGEFLVGEDAPFSLPQGFYTEQQVRDKAGEHFHWLVDAFIRATSVLDEPTAGPLVRYRYVTSLLGRARREKGGFSWFWDFRKASVVDATDDMYMLFPMRYRGEREVKLGDVTLRVGTPFSTRHNTGARQDQKVLAAV